MELSLASTLLNKKLVSRESKMLGVQNLTQGEIDRSYIIKGIATEEEGMKNFLFSLGCYAGERVTIISILAENYIVHVKDARYSIDVDLAEAILI